MSGFAAFGTGFFNKLNANRDAAEDEERQLRKSVWEHHVTNTLPKVLEERRKDAESYAMMNSIKNLPGYDGNEALAYAAALAIRQGRATNEADFLDQFTKNPTGTVPKHVTDDLKEKAAKTFTYSPVEPSSSVPSATPTSQSTPWWGKALGVADNASAVQSGESDFKRAFGVDPTQPGESQFVKDAAAAGPLTGLMRRDKRAEGYQDALVQSDLNHPERLSDEAGYRADIASGDWNKIAARLKDPNTRIAQATLDAREEARVLNRQFQAKMFEIGLTDEVPTENKEAFFRALSTGKGVDSTVLKLIRTPEQRSIVEGRLALIKNSIGDLSRAEAVQLMAAKDPKNPNSKSVFDILKENGLAVDFDALKKAADNQVKLKNMSENAKMLSDLAERNPDNPDLQAQAAAAAAEAAKANEGGAEEGTGTGTTPEDTSELTPHPDTVSFIPNVTENITVKAKKDTGMVRVGDERTAPFGTGTMKDNNIINAAIDKEDEVSVSMANPIRVLENINRYKPNNQKKAEKAIRALRFNIDDIRMIKEDKETSKQFDKDAKKWQDYIPVAKTDAEVDSFPAGSLVKIKTGLGWEIRFSKGTNKK